MTKRNTIAVALGLLTIPALAGSVALSCAQAQVPTSLSGRLPERSAIRQNMMLPAIGKSMIARNASEQTRITARGEVRDGKLIRMTVPVYPAAAKQAQVTGVVTVEARIGTDGHVIETTVLRGPYPLRRVAEQAVKHWQYEPSLLDGEPVQRVAVVNLSFVLGRYTDLLAR
jgi:TonB family protein